MEGIITWFNDYLVLDGNKIYSKTYISGDTFQTFYSCDTIKGTRNFIADGFITLIFADPPFNIKFGKNKGAYSYGISSKDIYYKDNMTKKEYLAWTRLWMKEQYRVLKDNGILVVMAPYNWQAYIELIGRQIGFELLSHNIWRFEFGMWLKYKPTVSHYHFLVFLKGREEDHLYTFNRTKRNEEDVEREIKLFMAEYNPRERKKNVQKMARILEKMMYDDWKANAEPDLDDSIRRLTKRYTDLDHPCKLNEEVPAKFYRMFSNEKDWVMETFTGSGTGLVSSIKLKRNYIGFEKDEKYKKVILEMIDRRLNVKSNLEKFL